MSTASRIYAEAKPVIRERELDVKTQVGDRRVSTVVLRVGKVYVTSVFPCDDDGKVTAWRASFRERYTTREQAEAGHARVVAALRAGTLDLEDEG